MNNRQLLESAATTLLDPQARDLAQSILWHQFDLPVRDQYPLVHRGHGPTVLMLHGFDSSHLEFRRVVPLISDHLSVIIPDLYGFGFCPRHQDQDHGPEQILQHLDQVIAALPNDQPIGVVGASMGGSVAVELARRHPERINQLLLLAPAGLNGKPMPVPPLLDQVGAWFLGRPGVRRGLCRQAFANPETNVGKPELEIASLHTQVDGWASSLAKFARSGGFAGCGKPLPNQPLHAIWGEKDRILRMPQQRESKAILQDEGETFANCGHLPHIDQPQKVAQKCLELFANMK